MGRACPRLGCGPLPLLVRSRVTTPSATRGKRMPKYNPPPNWPAPPPGWTPPQGWKAPANWPPPPNGWKFWLPDEKDGSWFGRHKTLTSVGGLAALVLVLIGTFASGG